LRRQATNEVEIGARGESGSGHQIWVTVTDARERHFRYGHADQSAVENCQVHCDEDADWSARRPITGHAGKLA